jgi:hypothetical protein
MSAALVGSSPVARCGERLLVAWFVGPWFVAPLCVAQWCVVRSGGRRFGARFADAPFGKWPSRNA